MKVFIYQDYRCVYTQHSVAVYKYDTKQKTYVFNRKLHTNRELNREKAAISILERSLTEEFLQNLENKNAHL